MNVDQSCQPIVVRIEENHTNTSIVINIDVGYELKYTSPGGAK
jgi:hypothetical protein